MQITQVIKRDYSTSPFVLEKITNAIEKAMQAVGNGSRKDAEIISMQVYESLLIRKEADSEYTPTVEQVQDIVEDKLMGSTFHDVAKAYIIYRNEQTRKRKSDVFEKRINLKPYEYPHLYQYVDTLLAISQIEVAVKTFWGDIYHRMPKPEIGAVGATFAESEVRHHDAYSHLLEILGLNHEFNTLKKKPVIMKRVHYLETALKNAKSEDKRDYAESILLFSLFIEHVSLFSQFLIIMAFNKHRNMLKGISNAVEATSKEEQIHGDFGIDLIKIFQDENPEWFGSEYNETIRKVCEQAYDAESEVVDWIFESGELEFLPKAVIQEFIKNRFNQSLESIGVEKIFDVDENLLQETEWFDDEIIGTKHGDFFVKRSINYSKRTQSITSEDLF